MPSAVDKSIDGEDSLEPPSQHLSSAPETVSAVTMHVYSFPNALLPAQHLRPKRRQVKNACTHCQKACKKCDDARPCLRCVKYGYSEECVDSQRKERKKGVKRGPYKKRDEKGRAIDLNDIPPQAMAGSHNSMPPGTLAHPGPYVPVPGFPGFYSQYPPLVSKPGDALPLYSTTPYFVATGVPTHTIQSRTPAIPDTANQAYTTHGLYQPVGPPAQYHPQCSVTGPHGADVAHQYLVYPGTLYPKLSPETIIDGNVRIEGEEGNVKDVGAST
ncbi:hypothetical protein CVT25_015489 [Psilocybe cyanescens]|uniref:Zn(2)-C6 fungal-type domain-containing protein n=1 Tax=Psilocybe cyanescens TaxID=93625 RepID=A0A409WI01_PSICY|nr:hypothetical protein CVT25_015489 [Psilocybe cyanescens]